MRLRATILLTGKTAAGIEIPADVVSALGSNKRPPVRVTVKGYTYRSSIAPMGGKFMLGLSHEVRKGAGVAGGETHDFDIELDDQPRVVELPPDFKAALDKDAKAKQFFEGLNYSNKRRLAEPIGQIKSEETRQRRIERTIEGLREGRA